MSNEPTIEQMNEVIGSFMGYIMYDKRYPRNHGIGAPEGEPEKCMIIQRAKYHSSWDWLMPVVEKIEAMHNDFHGYFAVYISANGCTIQGTKLCLKPGQEHYAYFNDVTHESKLLATHLMVYQFIQWYNKQSTTNEQSTTRNTTSNSE